ncbi:MAG: hypothetical protein V1928_01980 [Parcubacteria group bacterium]
MKRYYSTGDKIFATFVITAIIFIIYESARVIFFPKTIKIGEVSSLVKRKLLDTRYEVLSAPKPLKGTVLFSFKARSIEMKDGFIVVLAAPKDAEQLKVGEKVEIYDFSLFAPVESKFYMLKSEPPPAATFPPR